MNCDSFDRELMIKKLLRFLDKFLGFTGALQRKISCGKSEDFASRRN